MKKEVFSVIPMRTWQWLGVNEAYLPEEPVPVSAEPCKIKIDVPAGQTVQKMIVNRTEQRMEITAHVSEGGTLHLIQVQMLPLHQSCAGSVEITGEDRATVRYTTLEIGASHALAKLQVNLAGDASAADVSALYFGDGERKIDLNYVITQTGKMTEANLQVRGALQDAADKIFRGTLDFRAGSKGSTGREKEEVILLNEGIRNRSVPLMLSGEEDVNGQHGVSAGKLDQEKLFYLMCRGLDEKTARKLTVKALFATVLEQIPDTALREEITEEIEERIADGRN